VYSAVLADTIYRSNGLKALFRTVFRCTLCDNTSASFKGFLAVQAHSGHLLIDIVSSCIGAISSGGATLANLRQIIFPNGIDLAAMDTRSFP
jgi:hypothetical protein